VSPAIQRAATANTRAGRQVARTLERMPPFVDDAPALGAVYDGDLPARGRRVVFIDARVTEPTLAAELIAAYPTGPSLGATQERRTPRLVDSDERGMLPAA
jgi:hypothetical protein